MATSPGVIVLRGGASVVDPLTVVLGFLNGHRPYDVSDPSRPGSFGEPDLRLANRFGARISAAEIAAILERQPAIERALAAIGPRASLAAAAGSVPWLPMRQVFDGFAGIRGVGFSKMTKALYPKQPALFPMLDSIVQQYLADDDPGVQAPFAERALGLVRGYKRDLDGHRAGIRAIQRDLVGYGYQLTEVRILDLLVLAGMTPPRLPAAAAPGVGAIAAAGVAYRGAGHHLIRRQARAVAAGRADAHNEYDDRGGEQRGDEHELAARGDRAAGQRAGFRIGAPRPDREPVEGRRHPAQVRVVRVQLLLDLVQDLLLPARQAHRVSRVQLTWAVRAAQNGARSWRLRTLPEPVRGSSPVKSTDRGTL